MERVWSEVLSCAQATERHRLLQLQSRALDAVAARAPVVEVGAGAGQWVRALRERRPDAVDVIAFDGPNRISISGNTLWTVVVWRLYKTIDMRSSKQLL